MILGSISRNNRTELFLNYEEVQVISHVFHTYLEEKSADFLGETMKRLNNEFSNLFDLMKEGNLDNMILKYKIREVIESPD